MNFTVPKKSWSRRKIKPLNTLHNAGFCKRSKNRKDSTNIFCLFYIFNHSATLFYKVQVYKPAKCCLSYLVKNFVLAIYIAASSSWRTDVHPSGQGVERKERFYPRYYYSTIALLYEGFVGVALGFGTAAICSKLQSAVLIARWLFLFYRQRLRWLNTSVSPTVRYPAKTLKSMTVATCPTQGQSIWPLMG